MNCIYFHCPGAADAIDPAQFRRFGDADYVRHDAEWEGNLDDLHIDGAPADFEALPVEVRRVLEQARDRDPEWRAECEEEWQWMLATHGPEIGR